MADLRGQVALVTGASRGVGRGVAVGLAHAGATVFATGRTIKQTELGVGINSIACDHTDDQAVEAVFRQVEASVGRLDILVNVALGSLCQRISTASSRIIAPFWQRRCGARRENLTTLVRAAFVASQHAARLMVPAQTWAHRQYLSGAQKYLGNRYRHREGGDGQDDVGHGKN